MVLWVKPRLEVLARPGLIPTTSKCFLSIGNKVVGRNFVHGVLKLFDVRGLRKRL